MSIEMESNELCKCIFAECDATFNTEAGLWNHMEIVHGMTLCSISDALTDQISKKANQNIITMDMIQQIELMSDYQCVAYGVPHIA